MLTKYLENVPFAEIRIGQQATLTRQLTEKDVALFATVSGDLNPAHLDPTFNKNELYSGVIGHGMWMGSLISAVLGTTLPGPGTIYLDQDLHFKHPMHIGDTVNLCLTVIEKDEEKSIVTLECRGNNQDEQLIISGIARVLAPTKKIRVAKADLPDVEIHEHQRFQSIIASCQNLPAIKTAIVHPVKATVLEAIEEAQRAGLIMPVLIGPIQKIKAAANEINFDLSQYEIIDTPHSDAAAVKAACMAASGQVEAIMKGSITSHELLAAIVPSAANLRTKFRISHAYLIDAPSYHKPLIVTDAAINIQPDTLQKADICQNAINLWRILYGEKKPKVAILAATEFIDINMQATIDAAILCKMAERGQIVNGELDGPLAFDNAISQEAAQEKGIHSLVAGDADILLVPDIESGNILAKQLTFLGHADAAGIVLGAKVPIILVSRADSQHSRLLSCALAVKLAAARKEGRIK